MRYRIVELRSGKYHILTRIQEAGTDYSKRNNHIAHHLAFTSSEVATLPNPASILLAWLKWRSEWSEPPRVLDKDDAFDLNHVNTKWSSEDAYGGFPPAIKYGEILARAFEVGSEEETPLVEHFRDSLKELRFKEQWEYPFTNVLLPIDNPGDYIWCGAWDELTYPYEIDFSAKPISLPNKSKPVEKPLATEKKQKPEPGETEQEVNPMKRAPIVEIPEEFDRKKRRRPKRKFGIKEFSKSVNYALLVSTFLCILIAFFFYWNNQDDVETLIQEKRGITSKPTLTPTEQATQEWDAFVQANFPASGLESAAKNAGVLTQIGETQPVATVQFLNGLTHGTPKWPEYIQVPIQLLSENSETNTFSLILSSEEYPNINRLTLLPTAVFFRLLSLEDSAPNICQQALSRQINSAYHVGSFIEDLRSFFESNKQTTLGVNIAAFAAIENFELAKEAARDNEKFEALLNIHRPFGLPDSASYLSINSEGKLSSPADLSYTTHIISLFTNHVLANYDSIRNTSSFRTAFGRINATEFESPYEASQAIYEALLVGEPSNDNLRENWTKIRDAWIETFIRTDLMEETIVSYTIEALENKKVELIELQNQFSSEDLDAREQLLQLSEEIDKLANLALSVSKNEEWVVFDKQTAKVAPESP